MKRFLKWIGIMFGGVFGVVAVAVALVINDAAEVEMPLCGWTDLDREGASRASQDFKVTVGDSEMFE